MVAALPLNWVGDLISHSHTTMSFHPNVISLMSFILSLSIFRSNFGFQYDFLDSGICPSRQICWCQKQPLTWIAALYLGKTISGAPGNCLRFNLYLKPRLNKALRRRSSGKVSFDRMALIIRERFSLDMMSGNWIFTELRGVLWNGREGSDLSTPTGWSLFYQQPFLKVLCFHR